MSTCGIDGALCVVYTYSMTTTSTDLHNIITALEAGDGCPVERAADNREIHDLIAACEDAECTDRPPANGGAISRAVAR